MKSKFDQALDVQVFVFQLLSFWTPSSDGRVRKPSSGGSSHDRFGVFHRHAEFLEDLCTNSIIFPTLTVSSAGVCTL